MKVRLYSSLTFLALCGIVMLFGGAVPEACSEAPADFPKGIYTSGSITLTFADDGLFRVARGEQVLVEAQYTVTDDQLVISGEKGPAACDDPGMESGTYQWKFDGKVLTLIKVNDTCQGRINALTSQPWIKQAQG